MTRVAIVLLIMGCVSNQAYPAKRFFRLNVNSPGISDGPAEPSVRVGRFRVASAFEGTEMVYRTGENQYKSDYYAELIVEPAALLEDLTQRYLSGAGIGRVLLTGSLAPATYIVEGVINEMYGDFRDPDSPVAHIEMQYFISRDDELGPTIVHDELLTGDVPIDSTLAEDLVAGWNHSLTLMMQTVAKQLSRLRR